jgi:uncharacterized protein (UPF0303 family)
VNILMKFAVNSQEHFQTNSAIHSVNTRNQDHLHRQTANLSYFKKSAYYAGIKIFNKSAIKSEKSYDKKAQY